MDRFLQSERLSDTSLPPGHHRASLWQPQQLLRWKSSIKEISSVHLAGFSFHLTAGNQDSSQHFVLRHFSTDCQQLLCEPWPTDSSDFCAVLWSDGVAMLCSLRNFICIKKYLREQGHLCSLLLPIGHGHFSIHLHWLKGWPGKKSTNF